MPADPPRVSPFGRHVRRWRAIRRMSQLDLAVAVGTTPRHLSCVETGIEVTTSQLRIELMFPADDDAEAYFRSHQPT